MENKTDKWKKSLEVIKDNSSIIFSWIICAIIVLLFISKISLFIADNSIITKKEVQNNYFDFSFTLVLIIILIRYSWFLVKNYRLSKKHNYIIFLVSIIYQFLRNNETDALWFSVYIIKWNFYYTDLITVIAILTSILLLRNIFYSNCKIYDIIMERFDNFKFKTKDTNTSFLIEDVPVDETKLNDNERIINELVNAIRDLSPSKSFIIGVNSIWGLGKTSFLKRLEHNLKDDLNSESKPIVFWFNAWQHQDEKSIINNFFTQLKKELSVFSGDSENVIDSYLKEMLALVDNKYINFFKSITDSVFNQEAGTIKVFYNEINQIIEKIDRKIIVFVDDIDRLNKNEILETLRVLRNIADFKNVVFICGFDREYVVKQSQIDNHYLDKIFNLEISLTAQNQRGFVTYLNELITNSTGYTEDEKSLLTSSLSEIFYGDDDFASSISLDLFDGESQEPVDIDKLSQVALIPSFFFESKRDVKKFFNELFINVKTLKNISDIELQEYLLLKLLLFRYKWIYKNFTSKRMNSWLGSEVTLRFDQSNLNNLIVNPDIDVHEKIIIFSVLKILFPPLGTNINSKNINQKRYFPIYFGNNIFNESFSFFELTKALEENKIDKLITDQIIGKENENLIKNDIKSFVLRYENIRNIKEYKQAISLIKKDLLGTVEVIEILDFIYLGETVFSENFKDELSAIFTNFTDAFGIFMHELNIYYSRIPDDLSLGRQNDLSSAISSKRIEGFNLLTKDKLLKIMLDIIPEEITNDETIFNRVVPFFTEIYYPYFKFRLLYEEIKPTIKEYFQKNFQTVFLHKDPRATLVYGIDYVFIANIFENLDERENIIQQAEKLINERSQWSEADLDKRPYVEKGWDNFIKFIEDLRHTISVENLVKYNEFLDWVYTYQANGYFLIPSDQDVIEYRNKKEGKND